MNKELDALPGKEDAELDQSLRPYSFTGFKGQKKIVENLKVFISAANKRGSTLSVKSWTSPGISAVLISSGRGHQVLAPAVRFDLESLRKRAGGTPKLPLKARLKAASES